jgi:hypothetical protein
VERLEVEIMNPRRSATVAAVLCGTGVVAWFACFGSTRTENTAAPTLDRLAPFLTADFEVADASQPTAIGNAGIGNVDVAGAAELVRGPASDKTAASDEPKSIVEAALTDSSQMLPPETPPVQAATASTPNAVPKDTKDDVSSIEILDECLVADICIDQYLFWLDACRSAQRRFDSLFQLLRQNWLLQHGSVAKFLRQAFRAITAGKDERQTSAINYFRYRVYSVTSQINIKNGNAKVRRLGMVQCIGDIASFSHHGMT